MTAFTYGCNLGPAQMARHLRGLVSPHQLWHANHRHITVTGLDAALRDIINRYQPLRPAAPVGQGEGGRRRRHPVRAQRSQPGLRISYPLRRSGGIAYHHISDMYIALFSHFIVCGVWEAVYILDMLKKNTSDIQPDTLHADTQGQYVAGLRHGLFAGHRPDAAHSQLEGSDLLPAQQRTPISTSTACSRDVIDWGS